MVYFFASFCSAFFNYSQIIFKYIPVHFNYLSLWADTPCFLSLLLFQRYSRSKIDFDICPLSVNSPNNSCPAGYVFCRLAWTLLYYCNSENIYLLALIFQIGFLLIDILLFSFCFIVLICFLLCIRLICKIC